jgi:uncharacterized membrane protein
MIPLLFLLFALVVCLAIAFLLTNSGLKGPWRKDGPGVIGGRLRSRNRLVLGVVAAILIVAAVLEAIIYDMHQSVLDLQYAAGGPMAADPVMVWETSNGGVSWGLYLGILLGVFLGLLAGTALAARRYPIMGGVPAFRMI